MDEGIKDDFLCHPSIIHPAQQVSNGRVGTRGATQHNNAGSAQANALPAFSFRTAVGGGAWWNLSPRNRKRVPLAWLLVAT
jgi:hypothetical protein